MKRVCSVMILTYMICQLKYVDIIMHKFSQISPALHHSNSSTYTHLHMLHVCECVHSCTYLHPSLFDPGNHATRPATHLTGVSKTEERSSENEETHQVDPDLVLQNVLLFELPIHPPKGHACTLKKKDGCHLSKLKTR